VPAQSPAPDEQRQTSVCKRLTNSDEFSVLSVSESLERTPFLTMDNRFKVLHLPTHSPTDTADALSELREQGRIKAFFEIVQSGKRVFTVEYP
jgi:predicted oxidoreductase